MAIVNSGARKKMDKLDIKSAGIEEEEGLQHD
jgi:hypothetical protein